MTAPSKPVNNLAADVARIIARSESPSGVAIGRANRIVELMNQQRTDDCGKVLHLVREWANEQSRCRIRVRAKGTGIISWRPCGVCRDCRLRRALVEMGYAA